MSYKGMPFVDPPAKGMFIRSPMILGAWSVPTVFQSVSHLIIIMKHMYPKVTFRKII